MDVLTKEQRKKNMQAIKDKDTKVELLLRKELWMRGYRYRKNCKDIYGKPDIAFPGKKVAIFCDGEFWHGYKWETEKYKIKSRREFWWNKIESNMRRDKEVNFELEKQGWTVLRFWNKEVIKDIKGCILKIEEKLQTL